MKTAETSIAVTIVLAGIISLAAVPAAAQTARATKVDMHAPAPRLPNGRPDFSGVWARPAARDMTESFTNANGTSTKGEPNPLPFTPWGQAQWDAYDPVKNGDFAGSCMPFGWIRSFHPHPMQIIQNNEWISFLFEQSTMFQAVNTEGLPHRKDWPPTWFGDSRGRWEGDTLVVDVTNFSARSDYRGARDTLHLVERFTRTAAGLRYEVSVEDPRTWSKPWTAALDLTPQSEAMFEYACHEGNNSMRNILSGARAAERGK